MKNALISVYVFLFVFTVATPGFSKPMQVGEFEKSVAAFTESVLDGRKYDYTESKKTLLGDMYQTSYSDEFYTKYDSVVRYSRKLSFDIETRLAACKSKDEFISVKQRYAEWDDFCRLADRAPEDFSRGYIKELTMDKKKDTHLPFEVEAAKWEMDEEQSEDIAKYLKVSKDAEKAVNGILKALKKKDEESFAIFFPEKLQYLRKAEPESSKIHTVFKREINDYWKDNMSTEIAPSYLRNDLENSARMLKDKNLVKVVVRRWEGDKAKFAAIVMEKQDNNNYTINDWATSFDMQNRRR